MEQDVRAWLFTATAGRLVTATLGTLILVSLIRVLQRSLSRHLRDSDTRYRARKVVATIGYVAAILFLSIVYSDKLGSLTVAFGVAAAGIAFALQEVIASVAGWAAVSFASLYKPGDRVQLGGIRGDVIDISLLRTTLMELGEWVKGDLYTGRIVRVSNSFVFKEPVFNYSGDFPFLWDEIVVPIKHGSDHKLSRKILTDAVTSLFGDYTAQAQSAWKNVLNKYLIEAASVDPTVTVEATDNWMAFTVRYVVDYKRRRWARDQLFTAVLDAIEATEGRVALASATFQLVDAPVIDVRLSPPRP